MPRRPRLQYENAIYHIVTRGDGRRRLFHDARHYERFTQGLVDEVDRSGWVVIAYCWMPNHIHALIKTPQPNLCRGMQHWLSGYANWYAKRNHRSGHLYQGRYKAFPVATGATGVRAFACRQAGQMTKSRCARGKTTKDTKSTKESRGAVRRATSNGGQQRGSEL